MVNDRYERTWADLRSEIGTLLVPYLAGPQGTRYSYSVRFKVLKPKPARSSLLLAQPVDRERIT